MSDENEYDENDPAGLRKLIKEQQKALKELTEQNAKLSGTVRQRTISDTLTAKGVNPKVAKFVPSDLEASEDAVNQWLVENADVFGFKLDQDAGEAVKPTTADGQPVSGDPYQRLNKIEGSNPGGDDATLHAITNATTFEEFLAAFQAGGGEVVGL